MNWGRWLFYTLRTFCNMWSSEITQALPPSLGSSFPLKAQVPSDSESLTIPQAEAIGVGTAGTLVVSLHRDCHGVAAVQHRLRPLVGAQLAGGGEQWPSSVVQNCMWLKCSAAHSICNTDSLEKNPQTREENNSLKEGRRKWAIVWMTPIWTGEHTGTGQL